MSGLIDFLILHNRSGRVSDDSVSTEPWLLQSAVSGSTLGSLTPRRVRALLFFRDTPGLSCIAFLFYGSLDPEPPLRIVKRL